MLSKEGAKTAPEIKERVQLSREHTARLMKKLYEEGYLEREAGKIPFRYSIKKEMEALLQKVENPALKTKSRLIGFTSFVHDCEACELFYALFDGCLGMFGAVLYFRLFGPPVLSNIPLAAILER